MRTRKLMAETKQLKQTRQTKEVKSPMYEKEVQDLLSSALDGKHMRVKCGTADVVTDELLIEIKHIDHWSEGLGQLQKYSLYLPNRHLILYLFGEQQRSSPWEDIEETCSRAQVEAMRHEEDFEALVEKYHPRKITKESTFSEITDSLDFNIVDLGSRELVSRETFQQQSTQLLRDMRLAALVIHKVAAYNPKLCTKLIPDYKALREAIARLQIFLIEANDTRRIALQFIQDTITVDEASSVPMQDLRAELKRWCITNKVKHYTTLIPSIQEILAPKGVTFVMESRRRVMKGASLHSPPEPDGSQDDDSSVSVCDGDEDDEDGGNSSKLQKRTTSN